MTGFQSKIRDVINQAAPVHATVAVANRGLSHFVDPSTTGVIRFMQKSGFPFALLTPQMSALLSTAAAAGTDTVILTGNRILEWLLPGVGVALELLEDAIVESAVELEDGRVQVVLTTNLVANHNADTRFSIRSFPISSPLGAEEGDGAVGAPAVTLTSPFILVPGDTVVVDGQTIVISQADQVGFAAGLFSYEVKTALITGFPELFSSTDLRVTARAAYQSEILTVPQGTARSMIAGPVAVDWVSGPMVADYFPNPESECYLEEFDSTNRQIVAPRQVQKNDTLLKFQIQRDQMLFWRAAEGRVDWNGTFMELHANAAGRAHLWTPCRPTFDPAPLTTWSATVPGFSPYPVLLLSRITPGSVVVLHAITKAVIPSTDYTVDSAAGVVNFLAPHANQPVLITYRPRLEWQITAIPDADGVEVVIKIGEELKQVYPLSTAGTGVVLTVPVNTSEDIDQIHVTLRKTNDDPGAFKVQFSDWQPRGSITAAIRYTLTTAADIDYDWASSGLLFKSIWPSIELLRARLDGESIFSRYLDNGRMLV